MSEKTPSKADAEEAIKRAQAVAVVVADVAGDALAPGRPCAGRFDGGGRDSRSRSARPAQLAALEAQFAQAKQAVN